MNVKQLINKLKQYPADSKVIIEIDYESYDIVSIDFWEEKIYINYGENI